MTKTAKIVFNHFSLWRVLHSTSETTAGGAEGNGGGDGDVSTEPTLSAGAGSEDDEGSSSGCFIHLLAQ